MVQLTILHTAFVMTRDFPINTYIFEQLTLIICIEENYHFWYFTLHKFYNPSDKVSYSMAHKLIRSFIIVYTPFTILTWNATQVKNHNFSLTAIRIKKVQLILSLKRVLLPVNLLVVPSARKLIICLVDSQICKDDKLLLSFRTANNFSASSSIWLGFAKIYFFRKSDCSVLPKQKEVRNNHFRIKPTDDQRMEFIIKHDNHTLLTLYILLLTFYEKDFFNQQIKDHLWHLSVINTVCLTNHEFIKQIQRSKIMTPSPNDL